MEKKVLIDTIGYAAAILGIAMFVPQAFQMWKTKETKAVSLTTFLITFVAASLWLVYGFLTQSKPVILVNSFVTVISLFIIYMKLRFK
jgi:MtN3 and saliva related transmembrane protein